MLDAIAKLLAGCGTPGGFAARTSAPAQYLELEIKGVGPLSFPVTAAAARKLRGAAQPAPFGRREQTLHDASVRRTWEIAGSRVKVGRRWPRALAGHLERLQRELGLPEHARLVPVLDKLLLYEPGQFFKAHQDSERDDRMVASLVVLLPSRYSGGALRIEQRGSRKTFQRLKSQDSELSLLAFYSDCQHEITPVKTGVRLALTYHLLLEGQPQAAPAVAGEVDVARLAEHLRKHFSTAVPKRFEIAEARPPGRLVYLLDHEYTQRSLAWAQLKGADQARVAALRAAAEQLDCVWFLALADVHEIWNCDEDSEAAWRGIGLARGWLDEESSHPHPPTSEDDELCDRSIELHHWIDAEGGAQDDMLASVADTELCFTRPSAELDPFETHYEGWQGNYGNTLERWYHRAALVLWPRVNTFALRAQASPAWAIETLAALPPGAQAELEQALRALPASWEHLAGREQKPTFFDALLQVAVRAADAVAVRRFVAPVGLEPLGRRGALRCFVALVERHGLRWAQELFGHWLARRYSPASAGWLEALSAVCVALGASPKADGRALADWLLEHELRAVRERIQFAQQKRTAWGDLAAFSEEATELAHVLAAALAIGRVDAVTAELEALRAHVPPIRALFTAQLLRQGVRRAVELREALVSSGLVASCLAELAKTRDALARGQHDWSIELERSCRCEDCAELWEFLASGQHASVDWPLNKERRQHVHGMLDAGKLPVSHMTRRVGSPYVLQLRKQPGLAARKQLQHQELSALLRELEGLAGKTRSR